MSAHRHAYVVLHCDHPACHAQIEVSEEYASAARDAATKDGWITTIITGQGKRDFCPRHHMRAGSTARQQRNADAFHLMMLDLSWTEIGRRMGCTAATARSWAHAHWRAMMRDDPTYRAAQRSPQSWATWKQWRRIVYPKRAWRMLGIRAQEPWVDAHVAERHRKDTPDDD